MFLQYSLRNDDDNDDDDDDNNNNNNNNNKCFLKSLWSSRQSFWLQLQRSRVRFPALPVFSE